ncbi:queuosine precursor transporter [Diaphorobacter sp. HDW4A]|nr:queuosine precursor transporter [Diaphorobacter sp. HDW4A]
MHPDSHAPVSPSLATTKTTAFTRPGAARMLAGIVAMAVVVLASNILVQYPINDWLTWGALSYPVAYLVSDLINRGYGPEPARRVAWVGFAVAVVASLLLAPPRIAIASGTAFILSQLFDISVFHRLRQGSWWRAPLIATVLAAILDTFVFWSIAFAGGSDPWITWALGDLGVKLVVGLCLLLPFRLLTWRSVH